MLVLVDVAEVIGSDSCRVSRLRFIWTQHEKKKSETAIKAIFLSTAKKINRRVLVTKEDTRRVLDGSEGKSKGPLVDLGIYARFHFGFFSN